SNWLIKWDDKFQNDTLSISEFKCSAALAKLGPDPKHPPTKLGEVLNFPHFVAAPEAQTECGSCWKLRYKGNHAFVTVVDRVEEANLFVGGTDLVKNLTTFNGAPEGYDWGTAQLFSAYQVDGSCCQQNTGKQCGDP
uniref:Cerato-platanin-like protein n=1 Tax=Moniliophthora perniciosa TaxID=153609 RepID=UPI00026BAC7C|nr:Chain A, Cerato-platanin-like protein [Moniliophthora perniciosa]3SUM_B Chain B, Cerato-platanin-like protein [Moniliophthora perniciosa]3SUM_C Chain C, Cerato-platanin-like protein [Moniliophthora perniciosa]3SUM_D Chain D, Cerato-platanin-like protein [Moniliophthora perniciosa]